jgi:tetratricopeptide (TPR) repeat protein
VKTISAHEESRGSNLDEIYVWMDTLVVNQHEAPARPQSWWSSTFHNAIKIIGTVILVVEPWHSPKALTRAWCLYVRMIRFANQFTDEVLFSWEIYGSARFNADFYVALAPSEKTHFLSVLVQDFKQIQGMLSLVDSRRADASNPNDLAMIRREIEASIGYEGVNRMVLTQIRAWLVSTAKEGLEGKSWTLQQVKLENMTEQTRLALLHNQIARLYNQQGDLAQARSHQENALALDIKQSGERSDQCARDFNNLGYLCIKAGALDEALPYLEKALSIRIEIHGDASPEAARTRYNLGEVFETKGLFEECLVFFQKSLDALVGADRNDEAIKVLQGIGRAYRSQGFFRESEASFKRALELAGEDSVHPDAAEVWGLYAALLTDTDRFNEARAALDRAREVQIRNLGADHPNVAEIENNLARLCCRLGKYEEGLQCQQRALSIDTKAYGERHLLVARDYNNLGFLLTQLSRLKEAEVHMAKALDIRAERLGKNHPLYARTLCNAAGVKVLLGEFSAAKDQFESARQVLVTVNPTHSDVAEVDALLGQCYYSWGKFTQAEELLNRALSNAGCPESKKVEWTLWLVKCLTDENKHEEARAQLSTAKAMSARVCAELDKDIFKVELCSGEARLLEAVGDIAAAIVKQREALESSPNMTLEKARDKNNLGYLLTEQPTSRENLLEGIASLEDALRIRSAVLGETNAATLRTLFNLGLALASSPETEHKGLQMLSECADKMAATENKLHAFTAKLRQLRLEALIHCFSPKAQASRGAIQSFLAKQPWYVVDESKPIGLETRSLEAYGRGDSSAMEIWVDKYAGTLAGKTHVGLAILEVLLADLSLGEARVKHLEKAIAIGDSVGLFADHPLRIKAKLGLEGNS